MTDSHRLYKSTDLPLQEDISGAKFWEVHLSRTMLTYFEVPPHKRFETHRHESEQITHVLQGELYFEIEGKTVCVGPGDTIAVPSMVPHAVFTRDSIAQAFDAWSPVPPQYLASSR
jgi:mannose-6-phosphate isomerase-like protein (cupin superfamily)